MIMDVIKIAFDVGGVLSRYPEIFIPLLRVLEASEHVQIFVMSDMHPQEKIQSMLRLNGIELPDWRVVSADYATHGEKCKAILCERIKADILIDDCIGYVATSGKPLVRLLVMPDPELLYYADSWKTDGSEGNFGRRKSSSGNQ